MAGALGYARAERVRRSRLVKALANQPSAVSWFESRVAVGAHLRRASELFGGSVVLLWEDRDESLLEIAQWTGAELQMRHESPNAFQPFVAEDLTLDGFAVTAAGRKGSKVVRLTANGIRVWRGEPINQALVQYFGFQRVLSMPVANHNVTGRMFATLDRPAHEDDLVLAGEVARRLGEALSVDLMSRTLLDEAASEERERLSHELHDGVLQSLAGLALHLKRAEQIAGSAPVELGAALATAQQLLTDEQRDLRFYLQDLRVNAYTVGADQPALEFRLNELKTRVTSVWGLSVEMNIQAPPRAASPRTLHELYRVVQEALANVARHSGAVKADVTIVFDEQVARITVTDDGRGFPFLGNFTDAELTEQRLGPVTLKARVHALDGSIAIESMKSGACLKIELPLLPRSV